MSKVHRLNNSLVFKPYIERAEKVRQSMTEAETQEENEKGRRHAEQSYKKFKNNFELGLCYLCEKPLKTFSVKEPCLHWLLRPKGLKKKHYTLLFENMSYYKADIYTRWVANLETRFRNINDLQSERNEEKVFEYTIKYKHIEWSFSCAISDLEGHPNSKDGSAPHFHFQMRLNGQPFINYSQNHVAFTDNDLWHLAMENQTSISFSSEKLYGEGMESILQGDSLGFVLKNSVITDDAANATIKFDTFVQAEEGKTIAGDDIADLIEESQITGIPMARLVERLGADVQVKVSPGEGVPEIASRTQTLRNK